MDSKDRKKAEFYARLASIEKLESLSLSEAIKLQEEMATLGFPWLQKLASTHNRLREASPSLTADIGDEKIREFQKVFSSVAFHDIHRYSRDIINGLLENGEFDLTFYNPFNRITVQLDRKAYRATEHVKRVDPQDEMILDLLNLIRLPNFPFRRCLACEAIFVPVKNQRYCSPICTYKATQQIRKKEKANYMRGYMRKRRRKAALGVILRNR